MDECKVCANADNEYCFACDNGNQFKPMSNADRIRAMTDEELAHFLTPEHYKFPCPPNYHNCQYDKIPCWICWARWLEAPVEVDNG